MSRHITLGASGRYLLARLAYVFVSDTTSSLIIKTTQTQTPIHTDKLKQTLKQNRTENWTEDLHKKYSYNAAAGLNVTSVSISFRSSSGEGLPKQFGAKPRRPQGNRQLFGFHYSMSIWVHKLLSLVNITHTHSYTRKQKKKSRILPKHLEMTKIDFHTALMRYENKRKKH